MVASRDGGYVDREGVVCKYVISREVQYVVIVAAEDTGNDYANHSPVGHVAGGAALFKPAARACCCTLAFESLPAPFAHRFDQLDAQWSSLERLLHLLCPAGDVGKGAAATAEPHHILDPGLGETMTELATLTEASRVGIVAPNPGLKERMDSDE